MDVETVAAQSEHGRQRIWEKVNSLERNEASCRATREANEMAVNAALDRIEKGQTDTTKAIQALSQKHTKLETTWETAAKHVKLIWIPLALMLVGQFWQLIIEALKK